MVQQACGEISSSPTESHVRCHPDDRAPEVALLFGMPSQY
jgi:hypothetical protein